MVKIKICGFQDSENALAAARAGADFLGLVFAPGRRQISPLRAREIARLVRTLNPRPRLAGVFAGHTEDEVNRLVNYCLLDAAQLSGGESWDYCRAINRPIIKAVHVSPSTTGEDILNEMGRGYRLFEPSRLTFLMDTALAGKSGGTGLTFDWSVAKKAVSQFSIMIAGGLNPMNVEDLLARVRPWGVDVSTGVETDGIKDPDKIKAFISKVRRFEQKYYRKEKE